MTTINIDNLTEDEARSLYYNLCDKFDWVGVLYTRKEAELAWGDDPEEPFTDALWENLTRSRAWRSGITDYLDTCGWEVLIEAVCHAEEDYQ